MNYYSNGKYLALAGKIARATKYLIYDEVEVEQSHR
jgi:hypothetical protein